MKEIIDKLDFIKIKNICSTKDNVKRIRQATNQDQLFAKDISDKGLLSKIYERILELNNKKTTQFTNGPKTLTDISPKKIYRWQIST